MNDKTVIRKPEIIHNETANILNTGKNFSSPPRYYENSTKMFEKLIEEIREQKQVV